MLGEPARRVLELRTMESPGVEGSGRGEYFDVRGLGLGLG